jgi:hypothetical protein
MANRSGAISSWPTPALDRAVPSSLVNGIETDTITMLQSPSMMQVGRGVGMVALNDALMELVTKKIVAPDEAYAKAVDKTGFEAQLKRAGLDARPRPQPAAV